MIKVFDSAVTFAEFPDEIALCVNISNCIGGCEGCSEPWLLKDIGEELTEEKIDTLIRNNPDITVFGLMGGDRDHDYVAKVANYIHENYPNIKVGMYSGLDSLDMKLLECLDYYKIGRWIMPKGSVAEWHQTNNGPLQFPWSNQLMFQKVGDTWVNITYKFRKNKVSNPANYIV